jgi:PAS domain-containing protein
VARSSCSRGLDRRLRRHHTHTQTTYLPDKIEGESPGFFAIDADITPWVEATRAMDEAQRLAQLGSWIHDRRSDIIVWTDELYRIFGEDPESFTPTIETIADRVHPDDIDRLRAAQDPRAVRLGAAASMAAVRCASPRPDRGRPLPPARAVFGS